MKLIRNSGFTLMEMLAVVGIIIILASLILTGVTKAKKYAYKMNCTNNLKTLHSSTLLYFEDYNLLPTSDIINHISKNYSKDFICPAKRKNHDNKLIANYETIELINYTNQFMNLDSKSYNPALFSDIDIRGIVLDRTNAITNFSAPHNGIAFAILTSGQFREITISQIVSMLSTTRTSGKARSKRSFDLLSMPLSHYDFLPAQYYSSVTMNSIIAGSTSLDSNLTILSGLSKTD